MEIAEVEVAAIQEALAKSGEQVNELGALELALVGGGCGEVLFG